LAEPASVERLIHRLAEAPPHYALPNGSAAHTRHYMPLFKDKTTKVFDAFFHIEPGSNVHVAWPALELNEQERVLLSGLLEGVGYLGRAESWAEAVLLPSEDAVPPLNAAPMENSRSEPPKGSEREQVLCPMLPEVYGVWRSEARAQKEAALMEADLNRAREKAIAQEKDPEKVKLTPAQQRKIKTVLDELFPATLFEAMHADTSDLHKQGWSAPPGSRRVAYARPPLETSRTRFAAPQRSTQQQPTIVRFALASDTVSADVRPRLKDALYLGENVRRALMSKSRQLAEQRGEVDPQCAPIFSGKNPDGTSLANGHGHAHVLCCDDDGDDRIDHLIIYAPMGFSHDDLSAMSRLRRLWQYGGRPGLLAVLVGQGFPDDFGGFNVRNEETPILAEGRVWQSVTPFILPRHPKHDRRAQPKCDKDGQWIDGPEMQVRKELARRGSYPDPIEVSQSADPKHWRMFARQRRDGKGASGGRDGYGFRLIFPEPVRGPIALGYACHFGLGLFLPIRE
jgi:CRISPR-associated protein Csb2